MKKLLTLAALASLTLSAFGQGQVLFNNRATSATPPLNSPIYLDVVGGVKLEGATYRAALLGGAVGSVATSLSGIGNLATLASPNSGATWVTFRTGGTFGGAVAVGSDGARILPTVAYGQSAVLQMVAWAGNYTTWADAYAAGMAAQTKFGWSNPITITTSTSLTDPNLPVLQGLNSFAITLVPEPSSMALLGLGAAALMIFRRRN